MISGLRRLLRDNKTDRPAGKPPRVAPVFPHYICLETTNACNLRCVQCLYKGGTAEHYQGKVGYIDLALAKSVLDQLGQFGSGVMLNGDGEALLHPKFHTIAKHAIDLGLPNVYFNTNGTLLTPQFTDEVVSYFSGAVSISLDGFKESHERIRRGSSYQLVTDNIQYLQDRIRETGAKIRISVAYSNYDQPAGEREEFVKYWVDRVDSVSIGEVYDKDYRIISNRINLRQGNDERLQCGVPWETFIVRWDGSVVPCSNCLALDLEGDFVLGHADQQALLDIWNGEPLQRLRRRTESWELQGTICEKCERWNMYVAFGQKEEDGMLVSRSGIFTAYTKKPSR